MKLSNLSRIKNNPKRRDLKIKPTLLTPEVTLSQYNNKLKASNKKGTMPKTIITRTIIKIKWVFHPSINTSTNTSTSMTSNKKSSTFRTNLQILMTITTRTEWISSSLQNILKLNLRSLSKKIGKM
jgi:hypothetical protein